VQPTISNLEGLYELGQRDGVDIRPTLLRVTTDLYVAKHTHSLQEERHYIELALRLIELVDAPTRAIVAKKLAGYAGAPAEVVQRLAQLAPSAFVGAAPPATEAAANPAGPPRTAADELNDLFFQAAPEERRLILTNLDLSPLAPSAPLIRPTALDAIRRLEAAALRHASEGFAHELERALSISAVVARRMIDDVHGEPLVVAAVALGMPADVLQRILLCLNPAISHSVQRVYELTRLYEEIAPEAARRMLAIWRAVKDPAPATPATAQPALPPLPRPEAHQPHYWHVDERTRSVRHAPAAPAAPVTAPPARPKIRWDEHAQQQKDRA
jgi:hypothetical protein